MKALICKTFGGYTFAAVDDLNADEFAEIAGAALYVADQEAASVKTGKARGKRNKR